MKRVVIEANTGELFEVVAMFDKFGKPTEHPHEVAAINFRCPNGCVHAADSEGPTNGLHVVQ